MRNKDWKEAENKLIASTEMKQKTNLNVVYPKCWKLAENELIASSYACLCSTEMKRKTNLNVVYPKCWKVAENELIASASSRLVAENCLICQAQKWQKRY